jgi:two-component system cell cycle sensor histidine kinase PleC
MDRVAVDRAREVQALANQVETGGQWPVRSMPVPAQLIDHKERLLEVSDAWLALTGYRREEVLGRLASSLLSLESARVATLDVIPDLRFRMRADQVVLQVKTADGRLVHVTCDACMVPYGDRFRVFAVMQPLPAPHAELEDYAAATGGWLWEMDAYLRFRWISRDIAAATGRTPDWFIGKTREEIGVPDIAPEAWSAHRATLERREPYDDFTYRAKGPDGPIWLRSSGRPVFDAAGRFLGYRGAGREVTAEVEAREAAAAAGNRLRATLEATDDVYALWDRDDRLVLCNDLYRQVCRLPDDRLQPGVGFEQVMRECLAAGRIASARGREAAWLERRLDYHRDPGPAFEVQVDDGRWLLVRERRLDSGETLLISTDVTSLKQQQQSLRDALTAAEEAHAHRAAFMAQMSHELRTPMNAILGFAEVIESQLHGPVGDQRYLDYLEHIRDSGQHLLGLINDLLDIARIEAGDFKLREEALDLPAALAETAELLTPLTERKRIRLALPDGPPARLLADRRALRQVVMNLLSNAVKFSPADDVVEVAMTVDADGLQISVVDHGSGIPPEQQEAVWQPFAPVEDRLLTRPMLGTGLGLSVVRNLMEMHGGSADLESEVGTGTRVFVRFPAGRLLG